jgi:hypothetical protein
MATANSLYGRDFYTWAMETARAIRERQFEGIEWDAVAEELEDMGKSEKRTLESQLERLHADLLKWHLQSEKSTKMRPASGVGALQSGTPEGGLKKS